jgi:hypothetical protein
MTKGEAKKLALRWLDEATINGQEAGSELTADYIDKFNYFIDDVVSYFANIFKLERSFEVDKDTPFILRGGLYKFTLPEDYIELNKIVGTKGKDYIEIENFYKEGKRDFLITDADYYDSLTFLYYGLPKAIGIDAPDDTELEIMPKAQQLIPLKLAIDATAGSDETSGISYYLEGKLSNEIMNILGQDRGCENNFVERVYAQ